MWKRSLQRNYIQYGFLAFIGLLLVALHERVDRVMRHRHDLDNGQVVLTQEEVAADQERGSGAFRLS